MQSTKDFMTFLRELDQDLLLTPSFAQQTVCAREAKLPGQALHILPTPFQEGSVQVQPSLSTADAQQLHQVYGPQKPQKENSPSTSLL
jgi:hypothetical protein